VSHVVSDVTNNSAMETLLRRLSHLLESVRQVKEGLMGENQPNILSPDRKNLRYEGINHILIILTSNDILYGVTPWFIFLTDQSMMSLPVFHRAHTESCCYICQYIELSCI